MDRARLPGYPGSKTEDSFKRLLDFASDAVFVADLNGDYIYVNEKSVQMTGYSYDEFMRMSIRDLSFEEDVLAHLELFVKLKESGQSLAEIRLKSKDNQAIYVELNAIVLPENMIYGSCRDVRERMKSQLLLLEKEENLRITLDSIGDAVIYTDVHGIIFGLNKVAANLTGYSQDQAIGRPLTEVFSIRNSITGEKAADPVARVIESGRVVGLANHTELISRSGSSFSISDSAAPILNDKGEIKGVVLVFRDDTAKYLEQEVKAFRVSITEFASSHSIDELLRFSLQGIARYTAASRVFLKLCSENEDEGSIWSNADFKPEQLAEIEKQFPTRELIPVFEKEQQVCELRILKSSGEFSEQIMEIARFLAHVCWKTKGARQNELEVLNSEARFRKVFMLNPDAALLVRSDSGVITLVNPGMCQLVGLSENELMGQMLDTLVKSEIEVDSVLIYLKEKGHVENLHVNLVCGDQSTKEGLLSSSYIELDDQTYLVIYMLDISEKQKYLRLHLESVEHIKKQEELTRTIMDNLPIGIAVNSVFPQVEFVYMNDKFPDFYRTEKSKLNHPDSFWDEVYEDEDFRKEIKARIIEDAASGDPERLKWEAVPITRKGLPTRYVSAYNTPIPESNLVISTVIDITSQVHAEERLLLLDRTVEQSPISIVITNQNGLIEYVNPMFSQITGYTVDEAIGQNPRILSSGYHSKPFYKKLWETILSGNNWKGEFCNRNKSGEIYWEKAILSPIRNRQGVITHIVAVKEDITRYKRLEKVRQLISEIAKLSYVTFDLHDYAQQIQLKLKTVLHADNFYLGIYDELNHTYTFPHYQNQYNKIDVSKSLSLPNSLADYVRKKGRAVLLLKSEVEQMMNEGIVDRKGKIADYWLGAPLIDSRTQNPMGVLSVESYNPLEAYTQDDLSTFEIIASQIGLFIERVKAVDDLKEAKVKAEESDKLKSAFLANMSHEIRTPLNGILGFTDLLGNHSLEEEERNEYVSIIKKSGQRLLDTVNDIIEISKIETGQIDLHLMPISLREVFLDLYDFFSMEASAKGVEFQLLGDAPDLHILADKIKLQSILSNLIKNAVKFTNHGKIRLGYYLINGNIEFHVKDSGIGIPADKLKSIFNRFEQANNSSNRGYEGSGLGLAITKAFIELMNGHIWVDSQEHKGSTFSFYIPMLPANPSESLNLENQHLAASESDHEIPPMACQVIVAEDDPISFLYLKTILLGAGCTVIPCGNGREAIEAIRNSPEIHLILMDIKMPDIDGLEATRYIRTFNKTVPIYAQTGFALEGDKEKAIAAGCTGYLSKPVRKDEVLQLIKQICYAEKKS